MTVALTAPGWPVPDRGRAAPAALLLVALAGMAIAAGSREPLAAPGAAVHLGPLCYLLAQRWFGRRAALVAAVATAAPSLLWLGAPTLVLTAIGHVLVVDRLRAGGRSVSTITVGYQAVLGTVAGSLLVWGRWDAAVEYNLIAVLRAILSVMAMATIADAVALFVDRDAATGRLVRRPLVSIADAIDLLVSAAIAGAAALFLFGEMHAMPDRLAGLGQQIAASARDDVDAGAQGGVLRLPGWQDALPFVRTTAAAAPAAARTLGCARVDAAGGAGADRTFVHWLQTCLMQADGTGRLLVVSPRPPVVALMTQVLWDLVPLLAFLVAAEGALLAFRRAIRTSVSGWSEALHRFERNEPIEPGAVPFAETHALLTQFSGLNDALIAAEDERQRLGRAVDELRATIGLKLFSDVWFDADAGVLTFHKLDAQHARREMRLAVHAADRAMMAACAPQDDLMVEFRAVAGATTDWHLLIARDYDAAAGVWRFGCIVQLRAAKAFQAEMRHHARLMELGGMASALNHEMRQPLFTIALAAENGRAALAAAGAPADHAIGKFDRILEQVTRATAIVERTSVYARSDDDGREPCDLVQLVDTAARFMHPVLAEQAIAIAIDAPATMAMRCLPRVGIEQIVVNALQNAADSIAAATPPGEGRIAITLSEERGVARLVVSDNGAGVDAAITASAFDAFSTTKSAGKGTGLGLFVSRQIVDEIGGTIALANNPGGAGAALTLTFPPDQRGDQRP